MRPLWRFTAAALVLLLAGCGGAAPSDSRQSSSDSGQPGPSAQPTSSGPAPVDFAELPGPELTIDSKNPGGGRSPYMIKMKVVAASWVSSLGKAKASAGQKLLAVRVAATVNRPFSPSQDGGLHLDAIRLRAEVPQGTSCPGEMLRPMSAPYTSCFGLNRVQSDRMTPMTSDWESKPYAEARVTQKYEPGTTYLGAVVHEVLDSFRPASWKVCAATTPGSLEFGNCLDVDAPERS